MTCGVTGKVGHLVAPHVAVEIRQGPERAPTLSHQKEDVIAVDS